MLLLHAVNPYGFSHIRRVTEDNVDLNRNFQDFSKPLPENRGYAAIHDLLVPPDWDGPGRARAEAALDAWRDANGGLKAYQAAVAGGQYAFPDGLFFGGRRPTWSNATFRRILGTHGRAAKRVAVIDVHTGLGPTGYGEPISVHALEFASVRSRPRLVGRRRHVDHGRHFEFVPHYGIADRLHRGEPARRRGGGDRARIRHRPARRSL